MSIWFTSDTHFNHSLVATLRGHALPGGGLASFNHDAEIEQVWNSMVRPDDIVYHLGDVGLGDHVMTLRKVSQLNGRKRLIAGNHDKVWGGHKDSWKFMPDYLEVFEGVQMYSKIKVGQAKSAVMTHLPWLGAGEGDRDMPERHSEYRLTDLGDRWLIHGHTHTEYKVDGPRSFHVGWDAWKRPVHLDEVRSMIQEAS